MGYSPKRGKESDMTERLHFHLHGGGNEDNGDLLQKVLCTHCYTQCPQPYGRHRRPTPPPETPGHSQGSLGQSLVGSLLMSPGSWYTPASVCALQESVSQSYVRSGSSMVWLMATSSKRAYAIPKSAAPRAPAPVAVYCWPVPPQETLKHSKAGTGSVSVGSPGVHKILMATGLEKVSFHSNPKETQCQRMFKLPHSCTLLTH